jgi:cyanate permease
MLLSFVAIGVVIPVVGLVLKETPQLMGLAPDGDAVGRAEEAAHRDQEEGLSLRETWQTWTFWLMVSAFFFVSVSFHGCIIHLVPMLTDRGLSAQEAALGASLLGGGILLGRVATGYLLDCFFASLVAVCFFGATTLGVTLLWSGADGNLAYLAAVLVGLGQGAELDLMPYLVSRYFGLCAFGEIYGYAFAVFALGGVVGPLLMGMGFDATGSYQLILGVFAVTTLIAAGLMTRLGPYRVWEPAVEAA